jgi:hypothetical protein
VEQTQIQVRTLRRWKDRNMQKIIAGTQYSNTRFSTVKLNAAR